MRNFRWIGEQVTENGVIERLFRAEPSDWPYTGSALAALGFRHDAVGSMPAIRIEPSPSPRESTT
jgi:hypothetical protein